MGDAEVTSQYHRRLARPRGFSISDGSSLAGRSTLVDTRHAVSRLNRNFLSASPLAARGPCSGPGISPDTPLSATTGNPTVNAS